MCWAILSAGEVKVIVCAREDMKIQMKAEVAVNHTSAPPAIALVNSKRSSNKAHEAGI